MHVCFVVALIPAWIYIWSRTVIYKGMEISIPFVNMITSLVGLIIPVGIGIMIQIKKPNWVYREVSVANHCAIHHPGLHHRCLRQSVRV